MAEGKYHNLSLEEVAEQLERRDRQDDEINEVNRLEMSKLGFRLLSPKRFIKIDTSEIVGIENVVNHILTIIEPADQIMAIEGYSGVGKSSTTRALKDALGALSISFGEVFRYLTYKHYVHKETDHRKNIKALGYEIVNNHLCLCHGEENLTHNLAHHLADPELATLIPSISSETQDIVVGFIQRELQGIRRQTDCMILLEGRSFTLDFLPCDLRIELYAHPLIRAKRRLSEING